MKAVIYRSPNQISIEERPKPTIIHPTDAIIRILHTTICGTDLHILAGDVATATPGRILGHEGVGIIDSLGAAVHNFSVGHKVLISCITSCGTCYYCRQRRMPSQCADGGWILGNTIDGTQAEFVRVPHAAFSLHLLPRVIDERVAVTLSDTVPTAYECGILNGEIAPGSNVAIIGTGPIGLMCLQMSRKMFCPSVVVVVGRGMRRVEMAKEMGADHAFSVLGEGGAEKVVEDAMAVSTGGRGFDVVIEAVGNTESFEMAQGLVGPGGTIASLGVFGCSCELRLEKLWHRNICLRTRLIDAVSTIDLLHMVEEGGIDPSFLVTHRFAFDNIESAYEAFEKSSKHGSLKVVVSMPGSDSVSGMNGNWSSVNGCSQHLHS
ncbi:chaperonin 10-like protein [Aspergillus karnatakaensis]|uniref:putative zinc-containing alcohol dehydrogenase n=1 Tax=Aspergillus karnatakaensis TaxID=1810916 RepID=UPI003CCD7D07